MQDCAAWRQPSRPPPKLVTGPQCGARRQWWSSPRAAAALPRTPPCCARACPCPSPRRAAPHAPGVAPAGLACWLGLVCRGSACRRVACLGSCARPFRLVLSLVPFSGPQVNRPTCGRPRRTRRGKGTLTHADPSACLCSAQVLTNADFLARKRAGAILPGPFGGWTDTAARPPAREGVAAAAPPGAGPSAGAAGVHDEGVLARAAKRLKRRRDDGGHGEGGGPRQWCSIM